MQNANKIADTYIACWNEADSTRRAALIARAFTESATYVDPLMRSEGRSGIGAMIGAAQAQFPGLRFRKAGEAEAHADNIRFSWHLGPEEGPAIAGGTDFGTIADGKLAAVVGFLDFMPQS